MIKMWVSDKGYIQLAIRSGQYKKLTVSEVKEGELVSYNPITEEFELKPITNMAQRTQLPVVGYYAMFELVNGYRKEIFWTKEEMEFHARTYSAGYRSDLKYKSANTFWSKNFDQMAKKTLLRQLISKWGIMSVEMEKAFVGDMAVIREDGSADYVDNSVDVTEKVSENIETTANTVDFDSAEFEQATIEG